MRPDQDAAARLDAEQALTLERLAALDADFAAIVAATVDSNVDDEHDPEGTTIAFERSQVDSLIRQAKSHLTEIEAARGRLDAGTYRTCEKCGDPIGEARLEARPVARRCIVCAALP